MAADRAWPGELGHDIEIEVADGLTEALLGRTNRNLVVPRCGRGASPDESLESAARLYRVEQIGIDNARKPDEPLP